MSTPESIVVSLEWAKKLKEAGWPQRAANFWWENQVSKDAPPSYRIVNYARMELAAPTAEEILRRLPYSIELENRYARIDLGIVREEGYRISYINDAWLVTPIVRYEKSLANAAAAMTCYLVEQGLLSFKND